MKTTITAMLVAGSLTLGALTMASGAAWAQARPEAGRGAEAGGTGTQGPPPERAVPPQGRAEQPPSEDGPAAQDEEPAAPACQDGGRKLELIV